MYDNDHIMGVLLLYISHTAVAKLHIPVKCANDSVTVGLHKEGALKRIL